MQIKVEEIVEYDFEEALSKFPSLTIYPQLCKLVELQDLLALIVGKLDLGIRSYLIHNRHLDTVVDIIAKVKEFHDIKSHDEKLRILQYLYCKVDEHKRKEILRSIHTVVVSKEKVIKSVDLIERLTAKLRQDSRSYNVLAELDTADTGGLCTGTRGAAVMRALGAFTIYEQIKILEEICESK